MAHPAAIGGAMKRTVWVALATGTMISGAAAIGVDAQSPVVPHALTHFERAAALQSAREAQRSVIEARYQADRAACDALGGAIRDRCYIDAHARKGRAMLEAAAPLRRARLVAGMTPTHRYALLFVAVILAALLGG
jgi:hypothetical protein